MRNKLIALLAGLLVFGVAAASAATLGGITSSSLGADTSVVAACDSDGIAVAYTTSYSAAAAGFVVDSVDISGMAPACTGQTLDLDLYDAANASVGTSSGAVTGASQSFVPAPKPLASDVEGIAVAISG